MVIKERSILGGHQNPQGTQPVGVRCRVRRSRPGPGIRFEKKLDPECKSSRLTDGIGRARSWPSVSNPGENEHHCPSEGKAGRYNGNPVVPGKLGNRRRLEGRSMGGDCSGGARHPRGGMAELLEPGSVSHDISPRSLANVEREISEEKWVEAPQWVGGQTSRTKYQMLKSQRPDAVAAGSTMTVASRFY